MNMDRRTAFKSLASLAIVTLAGPALAAEEGPKVVEKFDPGVPESVREHARRLFYQYLPAVKKEALSGDDDAVDYGASVEATWITFCTLYLGGCADNVELRDPAKKRWVVLVADPYACGQIYVDLPAGIST